MITSTHRKFGATLVLSAILLTGIYGCGNNAATEEKKADTTVTPAADTTMKPADTTKKLAPADVAQPSDTGRDIKVPQPTR
ncbi:hypothetical protein QTN47_03525 [Danxiaibacter flavus]|uniref:Uncharacterized protein n=1 Tax=Danxiaibacter flavus TaxID=3049108 RepID=A0ABV3Z9K2_9BACT|nr:hypothetical protein QNM32_03525 [Chitinophagaceae bacterium DXS]